MSDAHDIPIKAQRPGAKTPLNRRAEMLRVDHAGELGAVRIYQGQLAVLGTRTRTARSAAIVKEMAQAEVRHKARFDRLLNETGTRPTLLEPLWSAAGFALGAATALLGEKAAMAATVAVEDVIEDHYRNQIKELSASDPELASELAEFRAEELAHRDTGLAEGAEQAPAYPLLRGLIKAGCRLAIRIAEKV